MATVSCFPYPDAPHGPLPIPRPGSDGSYGGDNYFQYINVPAHKTFEWGYRRGNPDHNREEYLSQKDHTFKAKVRRIRINLVILDNIINDIRYYMKYCYTLYLIKYMIVSNIEIKFIFYIIFDLICFNDIEYYI